MEKLLKAKDVAEQLSISRSRAYGLMRSGEITTIKFGKSIRVSFEDLHRFILTHRDSQLDESHD